MLSFQPKKKYWQWLIVVLLAFGILFRCSHLEHKPYWGDESLTSQRISGYTDQDLKEMVLQNNAMTVGEIQQYQRPNSNRDFQDVMQALAEHGEHPPLYYIMARFWMQLFQNTIATPRTLSAVISLLAIPSVYFLCGELFKSSFVGWVAIALLAVSPIQVIYAQEARQYSLWTTTILLSSWALLRALRTNKKSSWGMYTFTLSLGLYTHLISVIVAVAHGIYVFFHESCRLSKNMLAYLLASCAGFFLFVPWMVITISEKIGGRDGVPGWSERDTPLASLVQTWLLNLSRIFIDFNDSFVYKNFWIYTAIAVLVFYAIYFLCKNTPNRVGLFVVLLIAVPALFLILPDLILGGRRSTPLRYFIPSSLGVQIAVAYLFSSKINFPIGGKNWSNRLWRIVTVVVVSSGVISATLISQADTWWFKGREYYHNEVAKIINPKERPIAIATWFDIRTLSHSLDSHVVLQDIRPFQKFDSLDDRFSHVFVYESKQILDYLEKHANYRVEQVWTWKRQTTPVNTSLTNLWQLERKNEHH